MKAETIIIRADAGAATGTGHVMRMLALAQAWRRRGGEVVFAGVEIPEPVGDRLKDFRVARLDAITPGSDQDASQTAELAGEVGASWVVLDGYAFGKAFQAKVAGSGARVAVVCDFPVADEFPCDCLINQNLGACSSDYPRLWEGARRLLGTDFALLREEFAQSPRKSRKARAGVGRKLLITLGGSDPANLSTRLVKLLGPLAVKEKWEINLLVGPANNHRDELRLIAGRYSGVECLDPVSDIKTLLEGADAVLSAGGSTCWELCFRGVPMAVVSIAENQNGIVKALGDRGAAVNLGWHEDLSDAAIVDAVRNILSDGDLRRAMSETALRLVDGRGADRVAAALHGSFRIVLATAEEGWVRDSLDRFVADLESDGHEVTVLTAAKEIPAADLVFYLSFWSLAGAEVLDRTTHSLVVHASDLPQGKGWSPMTWQILEGKNKIPVRLFEAEMAVDSGDIYETAEIGFAGHELLPELRERLLEATFSLCRRFVAGYPENVPARRRQVGEASFYARRTPESSRLDPEATLVSQFDLLRTVDNHSYPAFFDHRGHRYEIQIRKYQNS